ncbi:hypothetical protein R3W88_027088 [Solanum pinnatisectum]|uniref:indole-3-pyruvate monooxygenase n=1 Tax=Solanum pinnatisectum TaxID=50273 RepID=A0AAV9LHT7_9SOLN|nr:hypothetical protein R3W88_027088 [Solanum pinnatisectum]
MANFSKEELEVVVVGAGPSGIAVSACLNKLGIKNVVLEKEDYCAHLWKKKTYFCSLPFMPHATSSPKYLSKNEFIQYLDEYVENFNIKPKFKTCVELAFYNNEEKKWNVKSRNVVSREMELHAGKIIHSNDYKSGEKYIDKKLLVIGSGNYGMEIAFDLSNYGSDASIVVRSPMMQVFHMHNQLYFFLYIWLLIVIDLIYFVLICLQIHVVTREMAYIGMVLLKYLPISLVYTIIAKFKFGNLAKFGIPQPVEGPFSVTISKGTSRVIDVSAIAKIKLEEIKGWYYIYLCSFYLKKYHVLPRISEIKEHTLVFENGEEHQFDAIIFATGYKNAATKWLKDCRCTFLDDGTLMNEFPNHWKGENGLYCAGFSKRGLATISMDVITVVDDIKTVRGDKI